MPNRTPREVLNLLPYALSPVVIRPPHKVISLSGGQLAKLCELGVEASERIPEGYRSG